MTLDLLLQAIVRQTTILIAHLATSRGIRAPLATIANQVFADLVGELERQRVSRKVSADMFGLGLRTYRRKIQRLSESSTERGRSLWEAVLEYLQARNLATRAEILEHFSSDDERQVRSVLRDLRESGLVFSSGAGPYTSYRAAREDEIAALQQRRGGEGLDELLLAIIFREGPLSVEEIAKRSQLSIDRLEVILSRLQGEGRLERIVNGDQPPLYRAGRLVIPLGASAGWEAAVFDHFKALVTTIICRLREQSTRSSLSDDVGGSTYTISIWPGHPLRDEVRGTLGRLRAELSDLRERAKKVNDEHGVPLSHTRAVIYVGQSLIHEGNEAALPEK